VVIAVVLSAEGFPLAYEILPGNTNDRTTLKGFLQKIQTQYGQARRIWIMDRGIPTEEALHGGKTGLGFATSTTTADPALSAQG